MRGENSSSWRQNGGSVMPTLGEWKKAQADRYAEEQQALVNVLQLRMKWHHQQWDQTANPALKAVHEELFQRDQDAIDELKEQYDQQRAIFKTRHKIDIPELKIDE